MISHPEKTFIKNVFVSIKACAMYISKKICERRSYILLDYVVDNSASESVVDLDNKLEADPMKKYDHHKK